MLLELNKLESFLSDFSDKTMDPNDYDAIHNILG